MEAPVRIALLVVGLGAGEILAAESSANDEQEASPIFVVRTPAEPAAVPIRVPAVQTPVGRELAALVRRDADAGKSDTSAGTPSPDLPANTLQLEKMTVETRRVLTPPLRETPL